MFLKRKVTGLVIYLETSVYKWKFIMRIEHISCLTRKGGVRLWSFYLRATRRKKFYTWLVHTDGTTLLSFPYRPRTHVALALALVARPCTSASWPGELRLIWRIGVCMQAVRDVVERWRKLLGFLLGGSICMHARSPPLNSYFPARS